MFQFTNHRCLRHPILLSEFNYTLLQTRIQIIQVHFLHVLRFDFPLQISDFLFLELQFFFEDLLHDFNLPEHSFKELTIK